MILPPPLSSAGVPITYSVPAVSYTHLDNAIDAAAMLPINQRWIKLTMHIRANYLYIEAENSRTGEVLHDAKGNIISSKGKNHGYGMKTMLDIARRYHSDLQVDILPDVYKRQAISTYIVIISESCSIAY